MMNLFDHHWHVVSQTEAPLAARMRPRTLDEFVGQTAIVGPGRLLRRAIQADQLSSLIFYGPPGTGKTTLAQIIANTTRAHFIPLNAVLAGVKDIRAAVDTAQDRRGKYNQRTILFVDEVHRFNKAQQDALLPWVENGTIVLIGATTENPYFEVNKALVSRSRLFQLKPLTAPDLERILDQTLVEGDRGYGHRSIQLHPDARAHLINVANGDARALLNALELAVETTPPDDRGTVVISLTVAEESIQQRAVLYDKEGDAHFDTISAFIKSLRGSDPDAALYWLARMVYSGEDPRYLFRRMIILASEDVGLADPQAVVVVNACAMAFDRVGLPEGHYPLAQAALYLANAPKSNSVMGFFDALKQVEHTRSGEVPNPLKDPSRDKHSFGHGAHYRYPHAYQDHWVAQQYLPNNLQGQVFYQPSDQGYEATIATQVIRRREAQLAAWIDQDTSPPELLSFGPRDVTTDRWLQRAMGQTGEHLGKLRDRLFQRAQCQRHHVVLLLNAGNGLLVWEAVRQVPEGGVYAQVPSPREQQLLQEQAQTLPELRRPIVILQDDNRQDDNRQDDSRQNDSRQENNRQDDSRQDDSRQENNRQDDNHQDNSRQDDNRQENNRQENNRQDDNHQDDSRQENNRQNDSRQDDSRQENNRQGLTEVMTLPRFDRILGRNSFRFSGVDRPFLHPQYLANNGQLILVETLPEHTQRLYRWLDRAWLDNTCYHQLVEGEEAIYRQDPQLNWKAEDLKLALEALGFVVHLEIEPTLTSLHITPGLIQRWFSGDRTSYASRLSQYLAPDTLDQVHQAFQTHLCHQSVQQGGAIAWITAQISA